MNIQDIVNTALDNALGNGYFDPGMSLHDCDAFSIALDLVEYDASCETLDSTELAQPVENWLQSNIKSNPFRYL